METILNQIQRKKNQVKQVLDKASEYKWITAADAKKYSTELDNETLTLGIVGQIKTGKSTFLNAFIFGDSVLPTAVETKTAALTVITYGEKEELEVEFLSAEEWKQLESKASRLDDRIGMVGIDDEEKDECEYAKKKVELAAQIGMEIKSLLGTKKKLPLGKLDEYAGRDGKYNPITKLIKICYPKEFLKGVEIVDTPGVNDPDTLREAISKKFLKDADVVLLIIGETLDSNDCKFLFKDVAPCGIGKVLFASNKYDYIYENDKNYTRDNVSTYHYNTLLQASEKYGELKMKKIIETSPHPIPISALGALLCRIQESRSLKSNEKLDWAKLCEIFGKSDTDDIMDESNILALESEVLKIIDKEARIGILLSSKEDFVRKCGENLIKNVNNSIQIERSNLETLDMNDFELQERIEELNAARERIEKKLTELSNNLKNEMVIIKKQGKYKIDGLISQLRDNLKRKVETLKIKELCSNFQSIKQDTFDIAGKEIDDIIFNVDKKVREIIEVHFFNSLRDILERSNCEGFEDTMNCIRSGYRTPDKDWKKELQNRIKEKFESLTFFTGDIGWWNRTFNSKNSKEKIRRYITEIKENFEVGDMLDCIDDGYNRVVEKLKKDIFDELLDPVIINIEQIKDKKCNKERLKDEATNELARLEDAMEVLKQQKKEIDKMLCEI